jgi:hypothetical protein
MRKNEALKKLKSKSHRIYGIYDFNKNKLVAVQLSQEAIELDYDLGCYDDNEEKKIVSFDVILF